MRKFITLFVLCMLYGGMNRVSAEIFTLDSYKGMNTEESSLLIPVDKSPNMDNCDPSKDGLSLSRRKGQTELFTITYSTYHVTSFGSIKNTSYDRLLIGYGDQVEAYDTAYSATVIHSSATVGYVWDFAQYMDNTYATNGADTVFYTGGNTKTFIADAPKGTCIEFFNNTCFIADVSGNKARVYYSVYGDATDWTTSTSPTDGDSIDVADYGEQVVELKVLGNSLLVLCSTSLMKIVGIENPYQVIEVDKSIGCKSKGSVSIHLGWCYFLGDDGQKYKTNGSIVENVSEDEFYDDFDATGISQRTANFSTLTSQSDFEAGITSHTSTSISAGSVVLSTGTTTYTSAGDWNTWTLTNIDTTTVSGSMVLSKTGDDVTLDDFTDGNYTTNPTWTVTESGSPTGTWAVTSNKLKFLGELGIGKYSRIGTPVYSTIIGKTAYSCQFKLTLNDVTNGFRVFIYKNVAATEYLVVTGNLLSTNVTLQLVTSGGGFTSANFASGMTNNTEATVKVQQISSTFKVWIDDDLKLTQTDSGGTYIVPSGATFNIWPNAVGQAGADDYIKIDDIQYFHMYETSGEAISPIYDTQKDINLVWGLMEWGSATVSNTTNKIYVRTSTDSAMGDSPAYVEQTDEAQITETAKRYIQTKSTMATTNVLATPQINEVSFSYGTTGYYITDEIPTVDINTWGLFEVSDEQADTGASISYFTYSSNTIVSDSDLKDVVSWTVQAADAIIVVSTNTYIWAKAVYDIVSATQVPSVDAVTFNWVSGATTTEDVASCWWDERLYIGVLKSVNSSTNDTCFVHDPELASWWKYSTGCYPSALTTWKGKFIIASSTCGVVSEFLEGTTDLGDDITAYYYTKHMPIGSLNAISSFKNISIVYDRQSAGNLVLSYYLNGATTAEPDPYTLDMTGGHLIHIDNFNFPLATNAYYIQFKIYNESGSDFNFHSFMGTTKEMPFRVGQ